MFLHFLRRVSIVSLCFFVLTGSQVLARRVGIDPAVNGSLASGGANCTICHVGGGGNGSVQILGAPSTYMAGGIYDLTVRVSDAAQLGAGFQLSVEDGSGTHVGTLSITDALNTMLNDSNPKWVNHTEAGVLDAIANWASNGNAADYNVRWEAPVADVGDVTFFAAGNAIDNNHSVIGDNIYTTSQTANFANVPAVSDWGVIGMLLLLMTAGTLVLRKDIAIA
jgi:hypothetical protein